MSRSKGNKGNHSSQRGSDFRFFKNAVLQGLVSSRLSEKALEDLQQPDLLLEKIKLDKDSRSTTAGVVKLDGDKFFLKRYNNKNFKRKLKNSVRKTRPFKVLAASQAVTAAGIFTPEIFAALNYRRGLLLEASYLLSGFIPSAKTASQVIEEITGEKMEIFSDKVCRVLIKIHDAGILHGDVKISNILICPDDKESYDIGLLDFDGSRCYPEKLPVKKRARDMARLVSSYFLNCKRHSLAENGLDKLLEHFAAKYHEISGINLRGDSLVRRAEYLSTRVRKKK